MTITHFRPKATVLRLEAPARPSAVELSMPRRTVMNVRPSAGGVEIRCPAGSLWLTQAGDPADYVLEAGGTYRTSRPGLVVVQALEESTVSFTDASGCSCAVSV